MTDNFNRDEMGEYDRQMYRSALVTLFWKIISDRKRRSGGYKLQKLADDLSVNKSTVSRWFSSSLPNWEADTVADIASALDVEIEIRATDRSDGTIYSSTGRRPQPPAAPTSTSPVPGSPSSGPDTKGAASKVTLVAA